MKHLDSDLSDDTTHATQDNKMLNEILVRIVGSCGYQTISAFDGAQALTVMMQTRVDLVLMDVRSTQSEPRHSTTR